VYAKFEKSVKASLSIRAYDADHKEVGRSAELPSELHKMDTAGFVTFVLDVRTPMNKIRSYELYVK
jgi:hypothetical protein